MHLSAVFSIKTLHLLDSIAAAHNKIPALTEFGYNQIPDSSWWTKVFLPGIAPSSGRICPGLEKCRQKTIWQCRVLCTFSRISIRSDFKKMAGNGKFYLNSG